MLQSFRLDARGVREVLRSDEVRNMVDEAALQVQVRVRAMVPQGTKVRVDKYTTDRGAASVVVEDVQAMVWQARDGILTRSAGEAGFEVRTVER